MLRSQSLQEPAIISFTILLPSQITENWLDISWLFQASFSLESSEITQVHILKKVNNVSLRLSMSVSAPYEHYVLELWANCSCECKYMFPLWLSGWPNSAAHFESSRKARHCAAAAQQQSMPRHHDALWIHTFAPGCQGGAQRHRCSPAGPRSESGHNYKGKEQNTASKDIWRCSLEISGC